jgi:hypothetical protein
VKGALHDVAEGLKLLEEGEEVAGIGHGRGSSL